MKRRLAEDELFRDMVLCVEVAHQKSFSRAAAALGATTSLLSRRVAQLEKRLGVQLVRRSTRHFELTDLGVQYVESCQDLVRQARGVHESVRELGSALRGHLRISLPADCAMPALASGLAWFVQRYPEITIGCEVSSQPPNLIAGQFDVAIRLGSLQDSSLVVHPLMRLSGHAYAAPAYLARRESPQHPRDLSRHDCIFVPCSRGRSVWSFHNGIEAVDVEVSGRLALNDLDLSSSLVAAGAGVAVLPDVIAASALRLGKLRKLIEPWSASPFLLTALTSSSVIPAKVRVFIDCLRAQLTQAISREDRAG